MFVDQTVSITIYKLLREMFDLKDCVSIYYLDFTSKLYLNNIA